MIAKMTDQIRRRVSQQTGSQSGRRISFCRHLESSGKRPPLRNAVHFKVREQQSLLRWEHGVVAASGAWAARACA
eukprot:6176846-Pleurochrysis_carterae.AAC.1